MQRLAIQLDDYHLLPGRLRITVPGMRSNKQLADQLVEYLIRSGSIASVSANHLSGRLLIRFDPWRTNLSYIQTILREGLSKPGRSRGHGSRETAIKKSQDKNKMCWVMRPGPVLYTVATGIALTSLVIKRVLVGRSPLASSRHVFNLGVLVTIVAGYPLLRSGIEVLAKKKRLNSDLLLFSASLLLLTMRESLTGLAVLWLVYLSNLFRFVMQARSRRVVQEVVDCIPGSVPSATIRNSYCRAVSQSDAQLVPLSAFYERILLIGTATISAVLYLLTRDIHRSVAVLLAGCPAAIALAQSTVQGTAIAASLRQGIVAKDVGYLEMAARIDTVLFDQTSKGVVAQPSAPEMLAAEKLQALGVDSGRLITEEATDCTQFVPSQLGPLNGRRGIERGNKVSILQTMRKNNHTIMLVGGGTNDTAALAASDIGVVLGRTGTVEALTAADVIVLENNPAKVAGLIHIGRVTEQISRQNLLTAVGLNLLGVALASFGIVTPLKAGVLLNVSTAAVVFNSARLLPKSQIPSCGSSSHYRGRHKTNAPRNEIT